MDTKHVIIVDFNHSSSYANRGDRAAPDLLGQSYHRDISSVFPLSNHRCREDRPSLLQYYLTALLCRTMSPLPRVPNIQRVVRSLDLILGLLAQGTSIHLALLAETRLLRVPLRPFH